MMMIIVISDDEYDNDDNEFFLPNISHWMQDIAVRVLQ